MKSVIKGITLSLLCAPLLLCACSATPPLSQSLIGKQLQANSFVAPGSASTKVQIRPQGSQGSEQKYLCEKKTISPSVVGEMCTLKITLTADKKISKATFKGKKETCGLCRDAFLHSFCRVK
ncbi:MAG: hypothetical protein JRH20_18025 [Deltaproteobacteria bacterium]|nr:hypothetical protein [Deltaproteobacteria bacterium]